MTKLSHCVTVQVSGVRLNAAYGEARTVLGSHGRFGVTRSLVTSGADSVRRCDGSLVTLGADSVRRCDGSLVTLGADSVRRCDGSLVTLGADSVRRCDGEAL